MSWRYGERQFRRVVVAASAGAVLGGAIGLIGVLWEERTSRAWLAPLGSHTITLGVAAGAALGALVVVRDDRRRTLLCLALAAGTAVTMAAIDAYVAWLESGRPGSPSARFESDAVWPRLTPAVEIASAAVVGAAIGLLLAAVLIVLRRRWEWFTRWEEPR